MRRAPASLWLAAAVSLLPTPAGAVETAFWRVIEPAHVAAGSPDGVSVSSRGYLSLAPRLDAIASSLHEEHGQRIVWSMALDAEDLIAGTGDDGRVLRIRPDGKAEVLCVLAEPHVTAVARARSGELLAATSPRGAIYRIGTDGRANVLFDPDELYIWSLAVSAEGTVFAGTGERGRIYRVDAGGEGTVFYDGEDPHIISLAFDRQGNLLAGTSGRAGRIIRFDQPGRPTVVFTAEKREITAIASDGAANIYAATTPERRPETPPGLTVRIGSQAAAGQGEGMPPSPAQPPGRLGGAERGEAGQGMTAVIEGLDIPPPALPQGGPRGILFRISPEGRIEEAWTSFTEDIFSLAAGPGGAVWFGTGSPGAVRRLERPGQPSLLWRLPQSQITALILDRRGRLYASTSNAGAVYGVGPEVAERGSFTSALIDTGSVSQWGKVSWEADIPKGARLEISTRTGDSPVPDGSWSSWSPPYPAPGGAIGSPPARYLQWRAELAARGGGSPVLRSLSFTSRPHNRAPRIKAVLVPEAGEEITGVPGASGGPGAPPPPGAAAEPPAGEAPAKRGSRRILITADDPDGDPLASTLRLTPAGGGSSQPVEIVLQRTEARPPLFYWDDSVLPEGLWIGSVTVSDEVANPPGTELSAQADVEAPVIVDRTPPVMAPLAPESGAAAMQHVRAADALSALERAEYSHDGTHWRAAGVADGILDSLEEEILVPLLPASGKVHIRVRDAAGNEATLDFPQGEEARAKAPER